MLFAEILIQQVKGLLCITWEFSARQIKTF